MRHPSNGLPGQSSYPAMLRITRLDEMIRSGKNPTVAQMAVELEVSERTVQRDLRYMQESMNMPIDYDPKTGGWRFFRETVQLPGIQTGTQEMLALMVARRVIEAQRDSGLAQLAQQTISSLAANMGKAFVEECQAMDSVISFRGSTRRLQQESDPNTFPVLVTAACRCEEVEVVYHNASDDVIRARTLRPLHLFLLDEKWYLFCRYPHENFTRRLLLIRMSQIRGTGQKFKRPARFNPEKELEHSLGMYRGVDPVHIRLRVDRLVARYLSEDPLHPSQKIVRSADGQSAELTVHLSITPDLEGVILRWGSRIEVLEPQSLRDSVLEHARAIVARG